MPPVRAESPSPDPRPAFALTIGDPQGIGPEIILKAILGPEGSRFSSRIRLHLFGPRAAFAQAAAECGLSGFDRIPVVPHNQPVPAHLAHEDVLLIDFPEHATAVPETSAPILTRTHSAPAGAASFAALEAAIARAELPAHDPDHIAAIITAPISKTSWKLAGITGWPGHTELLAERFNAPDSGMLFVGPSLRVMLASIHVPLMRVRDHLSIDSITRAIRLAHQACIDLGVQRPRGPRIAVCGLNPHAGEGGLLGTEDAELITPAITRARAQNIDAIGPLPGDTAFAPALIRSNSPGEYDAVVAMYHDQGLIPIKLIDGKKAVNITVGLPTIRTSPAHGTAFDIAGTNRADPTSMIAAIDFALTLYTKRAQTSPPAAPRTITP